jgi:hypothetical protein
MRTFCWAALVLVAASIAHAGDPPGWKEYRNKDNAFRVIMPGEPKLVVNKSKTGTEMKTFLFEDKDRAYAIIVSDVPGAQFESEKMTEDRLDGAVNGAVVGKYKLEKQTKITLGGTLRGRELLISAPMYMVRVRFFVVCRLYQIMAVGNREWVDSENISKFLDSFMLTQ